jgi:hypothetical protein
MRCEIVNVVRLDQPSNPMRIAVAYLQHLATMNAAVVADHGKIPGLQHEVPLIPLQDLV